MEARETERQGSDLATILIAITGLIVASFSNFPRKVLFSQRDQAWKVRILLTAVLLQAVLLVPLTVWYGSLGAAFAFLTVNATTFVRLAVRWRTGSTAV